MMNNLKYIFVFILLYSIVFSCKKETYTLPEGLLLGLSFEEPPSFNLSHFASAKQFTLLRTTEASFDGNHSLMIQSNNSENLGVAFWRYRLFDFELNKSLSLRIRVKAKDIVGMGFQLIMAAVETNKTEFYDFAKTPPKKTTNDEWQMIELSLSKVLTDKVNFVNIFMFMEEGTKGKVYFDKLELIAN